MKNNPLFVLIPSAVVIFGLAFGLVLFAQGPGGNSRVPQRQLLPCQPPTGASAGVYVSVPGVAPAPTALYCAGLGPGLVVNVSTAGVATISAVVPNTAVPTITRTLVGPTTPNSFTIPAGQTLRRVTDVIPMYAERGDYSIVGGAVVLTTPAAVGEVVEIESQ